MRRELTVAEEKRVFERFVPSAQAFIMDQKSFGVIKNISLGGLAVYCVQGSGLGQSASLDIFLDRAQLSLSADQYTFVSQRLTPGQAIMINHIYFTNLTSSQLDSLWDLIKQHCQRAGASPAHGKSAGTIVSFERHAESPALGGIGVKEPHFASQNTDTVPPYVSSTVQ